MLTFILGLLTGGFATAMLATGVYGMYLTFAVMHGQWAVLIFACSAFCLLFGYNMTKVVGQAITVWNAFNKTKERVDSDGKESESEDA